MNTLHFKTNLKCSGCVQAITSGLESLNAIEDWNVDLENPDKVLEINAKEDISEEVIEKVTKAGYQISRL
jgi:copper chaperone CopZ